MGNFVDVYSPKIDPCGGPRKGSRQKRFNETIRLVSGRRFSNILEVGCEAGYFLERLAPLGEKVVGVELSPRAVAAARRRLAGHPHIEVVPGNFLTLTLGRRFDLACCVHVITDFEPAVQRRLIDRFRRCLLPGGSLLCTVTNRRYGLFEPLEFKTMLKNAGFEVLEWHPFAAAGRPADSGDLAILSRKRRAVRRFERPPRAAPAAKASRGKG